MWHFTKVDNQNRELAHKDEAQQSKDDNVANEIGI
jgi:hypothetical protein